MEDNVELVRSVIAAYFRGDQPAMFELVDPEVVVRQFPDQPDVRDYYGHAGVAEVMSEWIGTWEEWSIEIRSARAVGELVLVDAFQRGLGKGSGAPIEADVTFLFTVRHGKITRWRMFHSEQQALEAVGLNG
ncbi:MAG TPA: nuclear transport factor 2 family protein [Solirubrobacteraceae bacterium]|nr:nuclear transport factor 2 family protein [Solirubrobacteraceae bacterium]